MKNVHNTIDEARLGLMLNELRLSVTRSAKWRGISDETFC